MFRRCLILLLACLPATGALRAAESGIPPTEHFGVRVYAQHNQTWAAVQDRAGLLYVGNKDHVLVYDGVRWGSVKTGGIFNRGLDLDAEDRVWVGAVDEFGYLEPDGAGGRRYVSLKSHWHEPPGTYVRQTLALPHGIYFVTETHVLRWHGGKLERVREGRARAFAIGAELVVHAAGQAVAAFDGDRWRDVIDTPEVRQDRVLMLEALPDGAWLVGLQRGALWRRDGAGFRPWPTPVDAALRARTIDRGWRLRDGSLAISQRPGGLLLLNPDGTLRHYLDTANGGLNADYVINVFQDRRGDLWISQNSGITRLAWPDGLTIFGAANGLGKGAVQALHRHRGRLYVGTTDGLFRLEPADPVAVPPRAARFQLLPGGDSDVWHIVGAGDEVLFAGRGGLHVYRPATHTAETVFGTPGPVATGVLVPRAAPDRALVALDNRLFVLRRESGKWRSLGEVPGVDGELRLLAEAADGAVWAAAASRGFFRLTGLAGPEPYDPAAVKAERFGGGRGLTSAALAGLPLVAAQAGDLAFLDDRRVYRFDAAEGRFRERFAAAQLYPFPVTAMPTLAAGRDGAWWVRTFRDDPEAGPWRGRQFWRVAPDLSVRGLPFAAADAVGENPYFLEEPAAAGSTVWLGGSEGLVRLELPRAYARDEPYRAVVRRVTGPGGRAFDPSAEAELPFAAQTATLQVATDRLEARYLRFQTRLDDAGEWSEPAAETTLTFDRLPPGRHVVEVRARDADGRLSATAQWRVRILAPWWRTPAAAAGYAAALAGLFYGAVRWRGARLEKRNRELARLVAVQTAELREAKAAAEAASEAKSAFLANMSHELRTPLNAILGFTQILRRSPLTSAEQRARLEIIGRNGDHLLAMINEILDLSKIEAGRLALNPADFSLRQLVAGLADTFRTRGQEAGLEFVCHLPADLPDRVRGDETKLRQVLYNLLGNAVKFTEHGTVTLAVAARPDGAGGATVEFAVADTGMGIAPEEQARLFEPFHQTRSGRTVGQGTGLGLAISRRLVQLMGGTIACTSAPGAGSRFAFAVHLAAATTPAAAPRQVVVGYAGTRRRLLVVDDEATNRAVLRGLLEPLGFEIEECADGHAALAAFARRPADAVLLDLRMPAGPDGYATARALRRLPGGAVPAIVAVSASVFEADRQTALDAGCDEFLPKPCEEERLFATLGRCLDLAWSHAAPAEPAGAGTAAMDVPPLPPEEARPLLELARRGDLRALRARLADAGVRHPACAPRLAQLDGLAAGFQLGRLREELRRAGGPENGS